MPPAAPNWSLSLVEGYDREILLYKVWCAKTVQHLMRDPRSVNALEVAELHANGLATEKQLRIAAAKAWDAAWDALLSACGDPATNPFWDPARYAALAATGLDCCNPIVKSARLDAYPIVQFATTDANLMAAWEAARAAATAAGSVITKNWRQDDYESWEETWEQEWEEPWEAARSAAIDEAIAATKDETGASGYQADEIAQEAPRSATWDLTEQTQSTVLRRLCQQSQRAAA